MTAPPADVRDRAASVRLLVLDVDGVLTDGTLYYGPAGEESKAFNVKDGLGIRLLERAGVAVAVVSAREAAPLVRRLEDLRVEHALLGRDDKLVALEELAAGLSVAPQHMAFAGDDLLDLPAMRRVGLAIAPADAHPMVRSEAAWVTTSRGGGGAVREIADGLLDARGILGESVEALLSEDVGRGRHLGA